MAELSWVWNGETACWEMTLERQGSYIENFWWFKWRKWYTSRIDVSVAGAATGSFWNENIVQCRACASAYATQIKAIETRVKAYLVGRSVRVYGGGGPGVEPGVEATEEFMRQPSDAIAMGGRGQIHPEDTTVEIDSISIRDPRRPNRVHIGVETCYPDPYFSYTVIFEGRTFQESVIVDAYGDVC